MRTSIWRFTALALAAFACSDSPSQPTIELCPGNTVAVQVSAGMMPLFTWEPACGVGFLAVFPAAGGGALWTVYGDSNTGSENPILSGVRYGSTPAHAHTVAGPQPLQSGTLYRVRVSRLLCDQGVLCTLHDAGAADFQPFAPD